MVQSSIADKEAVHLDPELGGPELILQRLAKVYAGPDKAKAKAAFRAADKDGSGSLDFRELCAMIKGASPNVEAKELRLLIAYISDYADKEHDFKTSFEELATTLQPFYS